jgi:hypothetical protein
VTGVASFILLADIGDQRLRSLHLNFEGGDQRVFRVNDNVSGFPLKFKANRKLHLCALPISMKSSTIRLGGVKLLNRCRRLLSSWTTSYACCRRLHDLAYGVATPHVLNLTHGGSYTYIRGGPGFPSTLANVDLSSDPSIDHINIDKSPQLHARVVAEVLAVVGNHKTAPAKKGNGADAGTARPATFPEQGGSRQNGGNPALPSSTVTGRRTVKLTSFCQRPSALSFGSAALHCVLMAEHMGPAHRISQRTTMSDGLSTTHSKRNGPELGPVGRFHMLAPNRNIGRF